MGTTVGNTSINTNLGTLYDDMQTAINAATTADAIKAAMPEPL